MSSPADGANGGSSIERSVITLVVGLALMLFFLLAVLGMGQVEKRSTEATRDAVDSATAEVIPASDIVGNAER
jgi:cytochrome oxidase assembly protein ShyY1